MNHLRKMKDLAAAQDGAIAPIVAVSLVAIIAAGGIAFDFAQMAALDTELQNAADQAALAAASQLDGKVGACSRAATAAATLISNHTLFANDGAASGTTITIANETGCDASGKVRFYQDKAKTKAAAKDADANFVEVDVDARKVNFALTPIVNAFNSGNLIATAFAGMGSAICNVPPVMICNPNEPVGNTNKDFDFDVSSMIGAGMKLKGDGKYAPGNFGFLDTVAGNGGGTPELKQALGWNTPPGDCSPITGVTTRPGNPQPAIDAFNTRFDIDPSGKDCIAGGTCSPARNVRKDLVRKNKCDMSNNGWQESDKPYRPATAAKLDLSVPANVPDIMGHPRDLCHAVSATAKCAKAGGRIGNGVWDRDAYFKVNYNWTHAQWTAAMTAAGYDAENVTRYQVYTWEMSAAADGLNPGDIDLTKATGGGKNGYAAPSCGVPGITPGGTNVDRRRISAAVINCSAEGINGRVSGVRVNKWLDLFLVEPTFARDKGNRTEGDDLYVEIIGVTNSGVTGATAGQVVRRDVPYLIE